MPEEIDVNKVAALARLKLTEDEERYYEKRFKEILDYVGLLSEVKIDSEMKEKDESLQVIYREDNREDSSVSIDQFSEYIEDGFFKVPKVIE
ncbi:Asp-tRNA(Asn)/Glu-tRNA(Gln) amidotransferase subunit GatC [bacterium]|nr:Asp-tRNA(Asn)/Glu-tRNA(Gln) amidotransferase subunit GatC [bacterium]